jgi:hypothetical protein
MVVGDNSTRWNSTYDSITRAIDLYPAIQLFCIENEDDLGQDMPTRETWDDIKDHAHGLKPFKDLTMELQSRATSGNHGSVWETLPALELLLDHMEQMKTRLEDLTSPLAIAVNSCWQVLSKYYKLTDESYTVYAMATLLNPSLRLQYFHEHWTEDLAIYIPEVQMACHNHWKQQYLANKSTFSTIPRKRTLLEAFLYKPTIGQIKDEFDTYLDQPISEITSYPFNLFRWHFDHKETFPTLYQMALDTLSVPAMSVECERVFSSAKKLLTPARNNLQEDIIEATECLKAWWDEEIIQQ